MPWGCTTKCATLFRSLHINATLVKFVAVHSKGCPQNGAEITP